MRNQRRLSQQIDRVLDHLDKVDEMPEGKAKQKHREEYQATLAFLESQVGAWTDEE